MVDDHGIAARAYSIPKLPLLKLNYPYLRRSGIVLHFALLMGGGACGRSGSRAG